MKLTFVFLTAAFLNVHAAGVAQKVTLSVKNAPLEKVFSSVEKQTGYVFFFDEGVLKDAKPVSVQASDMPLEDFLNTILKDQPLKFSFQNKTIVISRSTSPLSRLLDRQSSLRSLNTEGIPSSSLLKELPPPIDIKGRVVNEKGEPLEGATVMVKGTKNGTTTNANGEFRLKNVEDKAVLVISYVGMEPFELRVNGRNELIVNLKSSIEEQEAVTVVNTGYQSLPKERVTGSFVQLDNALINRTVSTGILDRIMDITSSLRQEPGLSKNITIRGYSTIAANNYPLIVVDGFPYEEQLDQGVHVLNNLNPNDVESITVLRDAAAASIWGARSGNGVIVITTKKGSFNKKLNVQFNASANVIERPRLNTLNIISSADAIDFEKAQFAKGSFNMYDDIFPSLKFFPVLSPITEVLLAERRGAITKQQAENKLNEYRRHDVRDDINKYLIQTAINQQYNVNVNGGSDKVSYYGSIGYDNNISSIKGNSSSRATVRIDNSFKPIKKVELRTFISYVQSKGANNGVEYSSLIADGEALAAPYTMLADNNANPLHVPVANGYRSSYIDTAKYPGLLDWHYRPLDEMKFSDNKYKQYSTRLGGVLKISLIKDLDIELKGQYESRTENNSRYYSLQSYQARSLINTFMQTGTNGSIQYPVPIGGILDYGISESINWNTRIQLNYNANFNNQHINAIGGYETGESKYGFDRYRRYGYNPLNNQFSQNMDFNSIYSQTPSGNNGSGKISSGDFTSGVLTRTISYFGNVGYQYDDRYSITISGRIDGSNFLGSTANQRLIPLWSSGVGWTISNENFYHCQTFPYLKLRATYGFNGNLNNKATPLPTAKYSTPNGVYHNEPYLSLQSPPNPGLTWEKIGMLNLGIDFQVKGNRVNGSIEYYTKRGINLIGALDIEATRGVTTYVANYGSMKGKGFDIMLKSIPIKKTLVWQNDFALSYNTDEITEYKASALTASAYLSPSAAIIGKPLQKIYSYPSAGLDPANGNPRGFVNGEVTSFNNVIQKAGINDLVYHGSAVPQLFGNMINTFTYNGVSLSFNITGKFKYFVRRKSVDYNKLFQNWGGHSDYAFRWQKSGDEAITSVPSVPQSPDARSNFYRLSSSLVERGDHIRLQDVRIAYSFNRAFTSKINITNASIFANLNNVGVIWSANRSGIDPNYPGNSILPSRSVAIGLNVSF